MKVLFVSSGNSKDFKIAPFIKSQGDSLINQGIEITYFSIIGKGFWGYLKNIRDLKKIIKTNPIDIIHAHYTLCGWIAVLTFTKTPIILSLMGSDAYGDYVGHNKIKFKSRYLILLTYLIQPFVKSIICKSKHIESFVYLKKKSSVIPNGILLEEIPNNNFKENLNLKKKTILFLGKKNDLRKNFNLAYSAIQKLKDDRIEIITPYPTSHETVFKYLNSVDILVVPSLMEGSPNVVKEAMACNCPIVATDVGDISWLFGNEPGHFIADFSGDDFSKKIKLALEFSEKTGRTRGREQLISLGLESNKIAKRIIELYKKHETRI